MTPGLYPQLVNGRFGDPALYVDLKFEKRALLFDLGDLRPLSPRKILRVSDIFVTHAHMDHFVGFDQVLRVLLGRDKVVRLYGPTGLIDRVGHKLGGYSWNLTDRYATDLTFAVTELREEGTRCTAAFHLKDRFCRSDEHSAAPDTDILLSDPLFNVRAAVLDHGIPCLAFAIEERAHVNIHKTALKALGLAVGPWLRDLKHAVVRGDVGSARLRIPPARSAADKGGGREFTVEELAKKVLTVTPGQKVAYVVDVLYSPRNAERIAGLARNADTLFIEATFARANAVRAAERFHLTTEQAGHLARRAAVRQVVPFHFSPRYAGQEVALDREVETAFRGPPQ